MRLRTIDGHVHELTFHAWKGAFFMGGWCAFYVYLLLSGTHGRFGPLVGIGLTGPCAVLFYERGRFAFDTRAKTVTWQRRSLCWGKSGTIPFRDIRGITLAQGWGGMMAVACESRSARKAEMFQ